MQKSLKLCLSVQIFIGETVKIVKNECADLAEIFKSPYFIVLYCWVFIASKEGEKKSLAHNLLSANVSILFAPLCDAF